MAKTGDTPVGETRESVQGQASLSKLYILQPSKRSPTTYKSSDAGPGAAALMRKIQGKARDATCEQKNMEKYSPSQLYILSQV